MAACRDVLEEHLRLACQAADHSQALVSLSLALGVTEAALTSKTACQALLEPEQLQAWQCLPPCVTLGRPDETSFAAGRCPQCRVLQVHGRAQAAVAIGTQLFHGFVAEVDSKLDHAADARVSSS